MCGCSVTACMGKVTAEGGLQGWVQHKAGSTGIAYECMIKNTNTTKLQPLCSGEPPQASPGPAVPVSCSHSGSRGLRRCSSACSALAVSQPEALHPETIHVLVEAQKRHPFLLRPQTAALARTRRAGTSVHAAGRRRATLEQLNEAVIQCKSSTSMVASQLPTSIAHTASRPRWSTWAPRVGKRAAAATAAAAEGRQRCCRSH
jgi:hypothetical protein